jgi:putative alpha-1,2-mannosidase
MLGIFSLCDAYYMGIRGIDIKTIEECIERELERKDFKGFLENGYFDRYTHIIDVTDACLCVAELTENADLREKLLSLAINWKNAYDTQGLMSELSRYYEGDRYNYSFRLQKNIEERIALAGGKESFLAMLESFFGFSGDSVKQLTYVDADKDIAARAYHRFEGFNNESDMETPYAYIFADRHDRLCEIIHECVHRSFGLGTGGIPGNNDSGGLSSFYVWNALGLFPVSGQNLILIGSPIVDGARLILANGNELLIKVHGQGDEHIYVKSVLFNGNPIENFNLPASTFMQGGKLDIFMQ